MDKVKLTLRNLDYILRFLLGNEVVEEIKYNSILEGGLKKYIEESRYKIDEALNGYTSYSEEDLTYSIHPTFVNAVFRKIEIGYPVDLGEGLSLSVLHRRYDGRYPEFKMLQELRSEDIFPYDVLGSSLFSMSVSLEKVCKYVENNLSQAFGKRGEEIDEYMMLIEKSRADFDLKNYEFVVRLDEKAFKELVSSLSDRFALLYDSLEEYLSRKEKMIK